MDRTYPIQSHDAYGFHAGMTADHRQVLIGVTCPYLVAFFFDVEGNFACGQRRKLEFLQPSGVWVDGELIEGMVRRYDTHDERILQCLREWQEEIGFNPGVIRVKQFFVQDLVLGIDDYPSHFDDILEDPDEEEAEQEEARESIREWAATGQFVLYWGHDYWIDAQGQVTSS